MAFSSENFFSNILVVVILASLAILFYCKKTGKTITDIIRELRQSGVQKNE